jgi:hypothetical protein
MSFLSLAAALLPLSGHDSPPQIDLLLSVVLVEQ